MVEPPPLLDPPGTVDDVLPDDPEVVLPVVAEPEEVEPLLEEALTEAETLIPPWVPEVPDEL